MKLGAKGNHVCGKRRNGVIVNQMVQRINKQGGDDVCNGRTLNRLANINHRGHGQCAEHNIEEQPGRGTQVAGRISRKDFVSGRDEGKTRNPGETRDIGIWCSTSYGDEISRHLSVVRSWIDVEREVGAYCPIEPDHDNNPRRKVPVLWTELSHLCLQHNELRSMWRHGCGLTSAHRGVNDLSSKGPVEIARVAALPIAHLHRKRHAMNRSNSWQRRNAHAVASSSSKWIRFVAGVLNASGKSGTTSDWNAHGLDESMVVNVTDNPNKGPYMQSFLCCRFRSSYSCAGLRLHRPRKRHRRHRQKPWLRSNSYGAVFVAREHLVRFFESRSRARRLRIRGWSV